MTMIGKLLIASTVIPFTFSGASAAFLLGDGAGGNKKVVNTETGEEHPVLEGIPGQPMTDCPAVPSSCPRQTGQKLVITDCTTASEYELGQESPTPVGGYPEGTFFLFNRGDAERSPHGDRM